MDGTLGSENQSSTLSSVNPDDGENPSDFEVKETTGLLSTSDGKQNTTKDERHSAAENDDER